MELTIKFKRFKDERPPDGVNCLVLVEADYEWKIMFYDSVNDLWIEGIATYDYTDDEDLWAILPESLEL